MSTYWLFKFFKMNNFTRGLKSNSFDFIRQNSFLDIKNDFSLIFFHLFLYFQKPFHKLFFFLFLWDLIAKILVFTLNFMKNYIESFVGLFFLLNNILINFQEIVDFLLIMELLNKWLSIMLTITKCFGHICAFDARKTLESFANRIARTSLIPS